MWPARMAAGLLALGLGSPGMYGVMPYTVRRRTREIGIRIALGAARSHVWAWWRGRGMARLKAGVVLGLTGALAVTRFAAAVMFDVSPTEPATFAIVTGLLLGTAWLVCHMPSRRAARADQIVAPRYE